jgi:glc operon protein GlcG
MKRSLILGTLIVLMNSTMAADLSLKALANKAIEAATEKSLCVSVAIVGSDGHLAYFERMKCAHIGSVETSIQKATSANAFKKPTSEFAKAVKEGNAGILTAKGVIAVAGGVPLKINGQFSGAIGIGGAKAVEDEEVANDAIANMRL